MKLGRATESGSRVVNQAIGEGRRAGVRTGAKVQSRDCFGPLTGRFFGRLACPCSVGRRYRPNAGWHRRYHHLQAADVPCGTLDITLYRDDLNSPNATTQPLVRTTEIGFDVDDKIIILVDDVLYTGRSARAAMDALIDLGRPKAIRLAVLVDRVGRELPIQADYAGYKADTLPGKLVQVNLVESDGKDEVVIE